MNPLLATVLTRALVSAIAAAPVPSVMSGDVVPPIPSSLEEAIVQAVLALIVVGAMYAQKKLKKAEQ